MLDFCSFFPQYKYIPLQVEFLMTQQLRVYSGDGTAERSHRENRNVFSCSSVNKCQFYLPTTNNGFTLLKLIIFLSILLLLLMLLIIL